ncbi:MAG: hypothetical protein DWQ44_13225 [Bacteroidetes bacterium]|nr:MAG: hypothetical protein DWQ33_13610 [Bacteroidota bacterium]REK05772.1 MAG: hypothetical protein DWQ39_05025 [Bacteroidota bacterium]REK31922.1 MAG: hypothetical protein DWQ44_13225 [Bacteroidota bacterium]REK49987.1 MAG: hypothetical protein DWQ48_05445 [Bacteroidota bacterium]
MLEQCFEQECSKTITGRSTINFRNLIDIENILDCKIVKWPGKGYKSRFFMIKCMKKSANKRDFLTNRQR